MDIQKTLFTLRSISEYISDLRDFVWKKRFCPKTSSNVSVSLHESYETNGSIYTCKKWIVFIFRFVKTGHTGTPGGHGAKKMGVQASFELPKNMTYITKP